MPAPISVVIPTLNAEAGLHDCLASLVEGLDTGLIHELIVSDGGSTDNTRALADAWGASILQGEPSRGRQLRLACAQAKSEWLLILHADTQLAPGWCNAATGHMRNHAAGWFQLRFDQGGRMVSAWANLRSRLGLPYGDQGLLLPRRLYDEVGGFPDIPLMEDVALARALRGRLRPINCFAITSGEKFRRAGWVRQGARNLWRLTRFVLGASPDKLAQSYRQPHSKAD